jgi:DAK2 domain fusion protein YloV
MRQELFDGSILREALRGAEKYIEAHIDELNLLNVFPVPDGDTGINMFVTLQAANKAVAAVNTQSAAVVTAAAARGALLGASGNSGVILSQILRGIAKGMEAKERFSCMNFAEALGVAAEMARRAVMNPVEGTILTVSSEASEMATRMAKRGASLKQAMSAIVRQSKKSVKKTPELMPLLKEAGVVDAGAKGLLYVFQGMSDHMGKRVTKRKTKTSTLAPQANSTSQSYGYDLQFLLQGIDMPLDKIRSKIETMGESIIVVGDSQLIRVHVHTPEPDAVLKYVRRVGEITNLVQENMDNQVRKFREKHSRKG